VDVVGELARVVAALPGGGEARPGQVTMAEAVAAAIAGRRHLVVQAGTGTGKSLGYLVPAVLAGRTTVVATATKALQDQLVGRDLPFLAEQLGRPVEFASLKGRSNYLCLQRAKEALAAAQGELDLDLGDDATRAEILQLVEWGTTTADGDRSGLAFEPSPRAWGALSVTSDECPGAARCPMGDACFAEAARDRAAASDVVVVNAHLYGTHLAAGRGVLPEHDLVVFDEVHQLEDVISATAGFELGAGRFTATARAARAVLADRGIPDEVEGAGIALSAALADHHGRRLRPGELAGPLGLARSRLERLGEALRAIETTDGDAQTRKARAQKVLGALVDDLDAALGGAGDADVAWVEGPPGNPILRLAPVDVAVALGPLWDATTAVLTSATVPPGLSGTLGLPTDRTDELDVGSPFDYAANTVLYCAAHLPDPRADGYAAAVADELAALIEAAGGRTLALFTSWRAMQAALDAVRPRLSTPILAQGELPKQALVDEFAADEATSLFATMGFWQGIDLPGRTLSLVTIDRLPFPRPDDPLLQARRDRIGRGRAFGAVDLPRAATLLAQGAGRLIRTAQDRGVVAVFDPRLATAGYRWDIVRALPPMRRTRHRAEAEAFLRDITGASQ
jgi:ATP-dependent DNA helicase DinG